MSEPLVIDPAALTRLREWGGEKLLSQMIRLFLDNAPTRMEQIRSGARQDGDVGEAEQGAHSLKSSAANLGAEELRSLAAAMESRASDGDVEAVGGLLPLLEDAYTRAREALESIVGGAS